MLAPGKWWKYRHPVSLRALLQRARGEAESVWFSDGAILLLAQSSGVDVAGWTEAPPVELWTAGIETEPVRLVRVRAGLFEDER